MSLYATAVKKPITTALCFVAVVIIGLFSLTRLSIDLYPQIETNTIMVLTAYPGASAADIETNVTKIMENTLNTVSDLKNITSQSKENMSIVTLEFEYGTKIDVATNDVRDKLDQVKNALPDNVQNPILFKFGTDDIPIVILSVTANESMNALYKILDDKVANPLKRISGVGAVSISGIPKREIKVYCDPQKLEAYGLSIEAISQIIAAENLNTPGGNIDIGSNTYSLRVQGEFTDAKQLENIVVGAQNGKSVYLHDVARIEDGPEERAQEAYVTGTSNGGSRYLASKGGILFIQKQSGANSVSISQEVLKRLPELAKTLPSDVQIGVVTNTSTNIENTINSLLDTILVTFIIVMVVVLVFLGRWRATFIIILTIPISLIASFAYLLISGNTLNIISLSSLSIAIGMVVDDAIVVLENVTNHIERGSDPKQAAIHGTNEVAISVIASTLTMLAVFLPLTMIPGMAGILFKQLGWIVSIIMIISTIGALTLTPMLCSQFL
ncbi:MAG: efflux RND transporter permease subunit, partial [Bacteroidales bacterium]